MWKVRYKDDRIEERRGQRAEVAGKLRAITSEPVQTFNIPPFIGEEPYIPLGVGISVAMRPRTLWGRYHALPLTKRQLKEIPRRLPLG